MVGKEAGMAAGEELAALKAQVVALEQRLGSTTGSEPRGARSKRNYVVHAAVFDECFSEPAPGEPKPPAEPVSGESVQQRLNRIEAQLQRIITMLEK